LAEEDALGAPATSLLEDTRAAACIRAIRILEALAAAGNRLTLASVFVADTASEVGTIEVVLTRTRAGQRQARAIGAVAFAIRTDTVVFTRDLVADLRIVVAVTRTRGHTDAVHAGAGWGAFRRDRTEAATRRAAIPVGAGAKAVETGALGGVTLRVGRAWCQALRSTEAVGTDAERAVPTVGARFTIGAAEARNALRRDTLGVMPALFLSLACRALKGNSGSKSQ
jgi:hypothetical protein